MRENLTTGSTPIQKAYLRSLIDIIEVDDAQVRIKGSKDMLEKAIFARRSGAEARSQMSRIKLRTHMSLKSRYKIGALGPILLN